MNWDLQLSNFNATSIHSWMQLINLIPRWPFIYVADCICTCFKLRRYLRIPNPLTSYILGLFLTTLPDNLVTLFNGRPLEVFDNAYLFPVYSLIWLAVNYCPGDLVFRGFFLIAVLLSFVGGFRTGRQITFGVDLGAAIFPADPIPIFLVGILFSCAQPLVLFAYARFHRQTVRDPGSILFTSAIACVCYYRFSGLSGATDFSRDEAHMAVVVVMSLLGFVHFAVNDASLAAIYDVTCDLVGRVVPFYGSTWIQEEAPAGQGKRAGKRKRE
jgi:hypothetical protein